MGILTTIQPNAAVGAPKLRCGTNGQTTLNYEEPGSMIYGPGYEDTEAVQYLGRAVAQRV